MIRLKDIAERAGVTATTVSKVLRDAPDISAETKARIRQIAESLGYVPDSGAQSLRSKKTHMLGVLISAVTDPFSSRVLLGLEEKASEFKFDLLLAQTFNDPQKELAAIERFMSRRVDGFIISPVHRFAERVPVYEELLRLEIPTVIIGPVPNWASRFVSVETDNLEASEKITKHLISLGHKKIAFLAGPSFSPAYKARLDGYRKALRDSGIQCNDSLVVLAGTTIEEGYQAMTSAYAELKDVTAIAAVNDSVAVGAVQFLIKNKFRVPQDVSVVGFGNYLISEYGQVRLTTVRQPKYRLGLAAIDMINQLLSKKQVSPLVLSSELLIRESTAPPPTQTIQVPVYQNQFMAQSMQQQATL
jgi:DNA-binding LacI/PurR family transcriptional regulator